MHGSIKKSQQTTKRTHEIINPFPKEIPSTKRIKRVSQNVDKLHFQPTKPQQKNTHTHMKNLEFLHRTTANEPNIKQKQL